MAYAFEVQKEDSWGVAEEEDIVDDLTVAGLDKLNGDSGDVEFRIFFAEQGLPFLAHEEHQDGVTCGSVDGAKGHDVEGVMGAVGTGET